MVKTSLMLLLSLLFLISCWDDKGKNFSASEVERGAFSLSQEEDLTSLLLIYVNRKGEVDYERWHQSNQDMETLNGLKRAIARADVNAMEAEERKSFYINAYNVLTLDLILSNYKKTLGDRLSPYPGKRSIKNIDRLDSKVWDHFKWMVGGRRLTLNEIEHQILRPLGDARVHFALVCASKGCPPLHNEALNPTGLNETLDQLASQFVNSGRDTRKVGNSIETSSILTWFEQDFVKSYGSVRGFFKKYALVDIAEIIETAPIKHRAYDWTLNDGSSTDVDDEEDTGSGSESSGTSGGGSTGGSVGSGSEEDDESEDTDDDGSAEETEVGSGSESFARKQGDR